MFKKLFLFSAFIMAGLITKAQKGWKEFSAFHEVISQTFHPAEKGKIEPIRTRSRELEEKAIAWQQSKAPRGFSQHISKKQFDELVKMAKELNRMVKDHAPDAAITKKLSSVHSQFHMMLEKCPSCEEEEKTQK